MNLALFITQANLKEVEAFCIESSKLQNEVVNGCLAVVHQKHIDPRAVSAAVSSLSSKFKVKVAVPVAANTEHGELAQISLLVSRFVIGVYTRYPGAWLLMDQLAMPTVQNWMQEASKQHNASGSKTSGRGVRLGGSLTPVGPFVLNLPVKAIRLFFAVTSEGWRSRGQYFFARCGFFQIAADEWLFRMGTIASEKTEVEKAQDIEPAPLPDQHSVDEASKALTKTDLLDEVERLTGVRPHHFTSDAKLRSILEQSAVTA